MSLINELYEMAERHMLETQRNINEARAILFDECRAASEHDEHSHDLGTCHGCGTRFCRNCSDSNYPRAFCCEMCESNNRRTA